MLEAGYVAPNENGVKREHLQLVSIKLTQWLGVKQSLLFWAVAAGTSVRISVQWISVEGGVECFD